MSIQIGIDASRANKKKRTGVEEYSYQIIQHLKKVMPAEVQVILYSRTPLKHGLQQLPENWGSKVLKWPPKKLWTQLRFNCEMIINPPDVLFIPGHVFPLIHPAKTIITIHDVAALEFPESFSWFERKYSIFSAEKSSKSLYKIITPTGFTKEELEKLDADTDNVHSVHHGPTSICKLEVDKSDQQKALNKYNIQQPFILFIGRVEKKKNVSRIVKSFNKIKPNNQDLKLVLAGKAGYGYSEIKKEMNSSPYQEDIFELGWTPEKELAALLSAAEMLIFPSLYEGFGFPVLEAFSKQCPVLVSKNTSLEEIAGEASIYVNPLSVESIARGMEKYLKNKELLKRNIQKGQKRLEDFSWRQSAIQTSEILLS